MKGQTGIAARDRTLISTWAGRLGEEASAAAVAALSGLAVSGVRAAMAERSWPLPDMGTARHPSTGQVVARTLDLLEARLPAVAADPEAHAQARRYALLCLNGLLLPGGAIAQMTAAPRRWRPPHGMPVSEATERRIEAWAAKRRPLQTRYRERAHRLQLQYEGLLPPPDWRALLHAIPAADPRHPPLPAVWEPAAARAGLSARFGHQGQMLAASKSRQPWSVRCVFNGRIRFADTGDPIWSGDLWLLPPPGPRGALDPRRGALNVAGATGRAVTLSYEHGGEPLWTATPLGTIETSPRGARTFVALVRMLDRAGWPRFGEWPAYPIEHRVRRG